MNQIDREKRQQAGRKVLIESGYTDEKEILSILGSPEKIRHPNPLHFAAAQPLNGAPQVGRAENRQHPVPAAAGFRFGNNPLPDQNNDRAAQVPAAVAFAFGNAGPHPPQNANPAAGLNEAPPLNHAGVARVPAAEAEGFRFEPAQVPAAAVGNDGPPPPQNANPAAGLNAPPPQNNARAAQVPPNDALGQNHQPNANIEEMYANMEERFRLNAGLNARHPPDDFRFRAVLVRTHHPDIKEINRRWNRGHGWQNVNQAARLNAPPPQNDARAAQVPAVAAEGFRFGALAFGNAGPPPQNANQAAGLNAAPPQNNVGAAQVPAAAAAAAAQGFLFGPAQVPAERAFAFGNAGPPAAGLNAAPPQNDARPAQVPNAGGFRFGALAFGNAGPPPPPRNANPAAGLNAAPPQNNVGAAQVPAAAAEGFRFNGALPPQNVNPAAGLNVQPPRNDIAAHEPPNGALGQNHQLGIEELFRRLNRLRPYELN
jgi:hypothetical protein